MSILTQRIEFLESREAELNQRVFLLENEIQNIQSQSLLKPDLIQTILDNFIQLFKVAEIKQRKRLLHSLIVNISVKQRKTTADKVIQRITLIFEPQEVEALSNKIRLWLLMIRLSLIYL